MFKIETERLILRDLAPPDENPLVSYFAESSAQPFLLEGQRDLDCVRAFVRSAMNPPSLDQRDSFHLAIEIKESGGLAGICTLKFAEPGSSKALLGWHISNTHSGKGFATESGLKLLELAFDTSLVFRVNADCFEHNVRARRTMAKLGMCQDVRSGFGKWWLSVCYSEDRPIVRYCIDANTWRRNRAKEAFAKES